MEVAIVGTGIAGNVVAHRLCREHEITVFEANKYIGGHANTVRITSADGELPLDTGFLVFNDRTYPNFVRLLDELGVESRESSMSFSVQCKRTSLEYNGSTLNSLFAQRRNLLRRSFYRMVGDILRFNREALHLLDTTNLELSLADYLDASGYSRAFVEKYLIPMGAAIWSADPSMLENMPASFFVRFFHNHGLMDIRDRPVWRVVRGGSETYVGMLVAKHRHRILLDTPVHAITRGPKKVIVRARGMEPRSFDYAFLACHSDQALGMLDDALPLEREILGSIPYQANEVVLHTDQSLMPKRRRTWGSWNYHIPEHDGGRVSVTYHLNRLQGLRTGAQYFVTLNSEEQIRPEAIIKKFSYDHPVFTAASVKAQNRHEDINGLNRTYYCGAYWRHGFHEDGVVSALRALAQFEARDDNAQQHLQRAS